MLLSVICPVTDGHVFCYRWSCVLLQVVMCSVTDVRCSLTDVRCSVTDGQGNWPVWAGCGGGCGEVCPWSCSPSRCPWQGCSCSHPWSRIHRHTHDQHPTGESSTKMCHRPVSSYCLCCDY